MAPLHWVQQLHERNEDECLDAWCTCLNCRSYQKRKDEGRSSKHKMIPVVL